MDCPHTDKKDRIGSKPDPFFVPEAMRCPSFPCFRLVDVVFEISNFLNPFASDADPIFVRPSHKHPNLAGRFSPRTGNQPCSGADIEGS